jgi:hypothetical protein
MPETDRYDDVSLELLTSINHRDFSVVEVVLGVKGSDCLPSGRLEEGLVGLGFSKRDPIDKANPSLGFDLALGRAITDLGRKVMRRANGRVKQLDDLAFERDQRWLVNLVNSHPELAAQISEVVKVEVVPAVTKAKKTTTKKASSRKVVASAKKS